MVTLCVFVDDADNPDFYTDDLGEHSHAEADHVPPNVSVLKLLRIK